MKEREESTGDDLAALYRDIFESDRRGARILEDLHARFGRVQVHTVGGIDAVLKTFKSGAEAAVIGYIFQQINRANNAPDPDPEEGESP